MHFIFEWPFDRNEPCLAKPDGTLLEPCTHVMIRGIERKPIFLDDQDPQDFVEDETFVPESALFPFWPQFLKGN